MQTFRHVQGQRAPGRLVRRGMAEVVTDVVSAEEGVTTDTDGLDPTPTSLSTVSPEGVVETVSV